MPPPNQDIRHLAHATGLRLREQDLEPLARWSAERMRTLALSGIEQYGTLLAEDSAAGREERERLTVQFSTGETYFFRDQGQFSLLAEKLLPQLIERRADTRKLRLWSAGCATGEEAYTLAMLVEELAPRLCGWDVLILGTDINAAALGKAREGLYGEWSFRTLDETRRQRYFRPRGRRWQIDPRLRDRVTLRNIDLVRDRIPDAEAGLDDFDLILCRNVFIYLDAYSVAHITANLGAALAEGGYLLTGHGELFGHDTAQMKVRMYVQSAVYQKMPPPVETPQSPAPSRAPLPASTARRNEGAAARIANAEPALPTPAATGDSGDRLMQSAWQHADRGSSTMAERDCAKASALDALDPRPYFLMAQLAQERGEPAQAKSLLKKVVYLDPFSIPAYLELGYLYSQDADHARSRRMYETARAALGRLPPAASVAPYSDSSVADILAYVERLLSAPAQASGNGAAAEAPLAQSA